MRGADKQGGDSRIRDTSTVAQEPYGPWRDKKTITSEQVRESLRKINPNADEAIKNAARKLKGV
jgi:hypothetical protein